MDPTSGSPLSHASQSFSMVDRSGKGWPISRKCDSACTGPRGGESEASVAGMSQPRGRSRHKPPVRYLCEVTEGEPHRLAALLLPAAAASAAVEHRSPCDTASA